MKFLFIVQGEGRGHMTQALAMRELIESCGHEVCEVLVGTGGEREIPNFFIEGFRCSVVKFFSPSFVMTNGKRVDSLRTLLRFISRIRHYTGSIEFIRNEVGYHRPDCVINFFEPLYGVSRAVGVGKGIRSIVIGHQYMFFNKGYFLNRKYPIDRVIAKFWSWVTGYGSEKIALSFYPHENFKGITVLPPLLREQLFETEVSNDNSVLVYAVNNGYVKDLINKKFDRVVNCFCEKFWEGDGVYGNLRLHALDGKKFLEFMGRCDTLFCTAGFESLCEAAYLGKKIVAIPTENHFEQFYNALDAARRGLVAYRKKFEVKDIPYRKTNNTWFKAWVDSYREEYRKFLRL